LRARLPQFPRIATSTGFSRSLWPSSVEPPDPLRGQGRPRLALDLDDHGPGELKSALDLLEGLQGAPQPDAGPGNHGSRKGGAVEGGSEAAGEFAADVNGVGLQAAQEREGQEAVRNCRSIGRFHPGSLAVDMNPLVILRQHSEGRNQRLIDLEPVARADL